MPAGSADGSYLRAGATTAKASALQSTGGSIPIAQQEDVSICRKGRCADACWAISLMLSQAQPTLEHFNGRADSQGGLRVLEWTGKLVPQGLLVKGEGRRCCSLTESGYMCGGFSHSRTF